MIKSIQEAFFGYYRNGGLRSKTTFYLYMNPTPEEYRKYICTYGRGFIDKDGNIYLEGYEEKLEDLASLQYSQVMHTEIIDALASKLGLPEDFSTNFQFEYKGQESNYGIAINFDQEKGDKKFVYLSELYFQTPEDIDDIEADGDVVMYDEKETDKLVQRCKTKNPGLVFDL